MTESLRQQRRLSVRTGAIVMRSALQTMNENSTTAEWAARITECRNSGLSVREWCSVNRVCTQTYYRWQKRLFEMAKAQQEIQFAEVTPVRPIHSSNVAVTVRISGAEADFHSGADADTVETVLRFIKSC